MSRRKRYDGRFKAQVAIEAIKTSKPPLRLPVNMGSTRIK